HPSPGIAPIVVPRVRYGHPRQTEATDPIRKQGGGRPYIDVTVAVLNWPTALARLASTAKLADLNQLGSCAFIQGTGWTIKKRTAAVSLGGRTFQARRLSRKVENVIEIWICGITKLS